MFLGGYERWMLQFWMLRILDDTVLDALIATHPGVFSGTKRHPGVFLGIAKDIFSLSQKDIFSFYQLVVKMFLFSNYYYCDSSLNVDFITLKIILYTYYESHIFAILHL